VESEPAVVVAGIMIILPWRAHVGDGEWRASPEESHYYRRRKQTERGEGEGREGRERIGRREKGEERARGQVSAREAEPRVCRRAWVEVVPALGGWPCNVISLWRARYPEAPLDRRNDEYEATALFTAGQACIPTRLFTYSPTHLFTHSPIHLSTLCFNTTLSLQS
jgi:hypothetical protein